MFILRDLLPPLQTAFSATPLGREHVQWFLSTLLAVIVPFTSSMTSNLLRTLTSLFGLALVIAPATRAQGTRHMRDTAERCRERPR
jgi:hypothetical protein